MGLTRGINSGGFMGVTSGYMPVNNLGQANMQDSSLVWRREQFKLHHWTPFCRKLPLSARLVKTKRLAAGATVTSRSWVHILAQQGRGEMTTRKVLLFPMCPFLFSFLFIGLRLPKGSQEQASITYRKYPNRDWPENF